MHFLRHAQIETHNLNSKEIKTKRATVSTYRATNKGRTNTHIFIFHMYKFNCFSSRFLQAIDFGFSLCECMSRTLLTFLVFGAIYRLGSRDSFSAHCFFSLSFTQSHTHIHTLSSTFSFVRRKLLLLPFLWFISPKTTSLGPIYILYIHEIAPKINT